MMHLYQLLFLWLFAIPAQAWSNRAYSIEERAARAYSRHAGFTGFTKRSLASNDTILYGTRFDNVTWDHQNWVLATSYLDQGHFQSRMSVANGYLGINVAAAGPFFEVDTPVDGDNINGWPLFQRRQTFVTIGGFFDAQPKTNGTNYEWLTQYGDESVISGIPHWSALIVDTGDSYLSASVDPSTITNFSSFHDYKAGVFTWQYTWTPANVLFDIQYQIFAHKLYVNQAVVQLKITPSEDVNVTIANVLDGTAAVRTDFVDKGTDDQAIFSAVRPNGISNVTAYIYANITGSEELDMSSLSILSDKDYIDTNKSSIAQGVDAYLKSGVITTITKFVGAATTDGFDDPQAIAKNASTIASEAGFQSLLKSHVKEWAAVFPSDSVDDFSFPENGTLPDDVNVLESAIVAVVNPYYLLQNTISQNAMAAVDNAPINSNSISVGGLTSDSYAGQVFWDAEIWMQPGLVTAFPEAAQGIANFRVARYGQALANAQTAYQSSKNDTTFSSNAAVFPWTDARFGNCTGTGPCFDYEYHINGDIALEFANYWVVTGDTEFFKENLYPIYDSIATFYSEVVKKNGSKYHLTNMTDPDEYANQVDDGGYTMPLIAETLHNANFFRGLLGIAENDSYTDVANNVYVGKDDDSDITLEYSTMNGSISVKQADVILDTFPLRFTQNYTSSNALSDLDYYANKQSANGPGMTYAIFSIVANEISPSGCSAYTYDMYSTQPYMRGPWFQFSEQLIDDYTENGGTHPAYPFLTGHGGSNQVVLFGYLGLRLVPSFTLYINPNLPPQIPNIRYRTFYWHGWPISAFSNYTHTTLTRLEASLSSANMTFANTSIPIQVGSDDNSKIYTLPPNATLTIPNRQVASESTLSGNILQCPPTVGTNATYVPGQFPLGAVDGAASTKWQPTAASNSASITISLHPDTYYTPIKSLYFDWASSPPVSATVYFHNTTSHNSSDGITAVAYTISNITVDQPYDAASIADISKYSGNTTNVTFVDIVYSSKYATLEIIGNQALDDPYNGTGAMVAEWAIVAESGNDLLGVEETLVPVVQKQKRNTKGSVNGRFSRYIWVENGWSGEAHT